ncbi:hypothetical protein OROMI_023557 [Orobanche minor]
MLRIKVPARPQIRLLHSVLQKCHSIVNLSVRMEIDVDAGILSWIKFSCPNLEFLEISTSETTTNWITGEELSQFVADIRLLKSLTMEGCSSLGGVSLCSSSLCTIWLSGLHSITKMVFKCPKLTEVYVDFMGQENDNSDLGAIVDILGRNCQGLQNLRIASIRLSNAIVSALAAAHLRNLRMLSLVLGSEITDASVDVITSSYPNLELLDLSGSSINDRGIGIICMVLRNTLSSLLVAFCPNISSSIIQYAATQLPLLQLLDYTLCLYCPELNDLNLDSCINLHPEKFVLQCPKLEKVCASGCQRLLIEAIQSQVDASVAAMTSGYPNLELYDLSGQKSRHGTTTCCIFFNGGVFVAVDTRSTLTPLDEESANRYVVLDVDFDCEDSYEDLSATPDKKEDDEKEEEEVQEVVGRVDVEGDIGVTDKMCIFQNNVLAAFAGNCDRWADATKRVVRMIDKYTQSSPLMIANQFKLFLKRSCTLRDSSVIDVDIDVLVVGYDSVIQRVRAFMVISEKNHMRLMEYTHEDVYCVTGSGRTSVDHYFSKCLVPEHDRLLSALYTIKGAMLHAALRDRGTGGDIKVFEVTPFFTGQISGETVVDLYSRSLLQIEDHSKGILLVHNKTSHKLSNKDIAAKFTHLSGSGLVVVSHVLAEIGDYGVRKPSRFDESLL